MRVSVAAEVRMTANVFPLKSVGEPLKNTGNQPGAYFVGCGRFMEMSLGCIGCPNCGGAIIIHLPDSSDPDKYVPTKGNLFSGEDLTFDRPVSHDAPHSCGALYAVTDGALVALHPNWDHLEKWVVDAGEGERHEVFVGHYGEYGGWQAQYREWSLPTWSAGVSADDAVERLAVKMGWVTPVARRPK